MNRTTMIVLLLAGACAGGAVVATTALAANEKTSKRITQILDDLVARIEALEQRLNTLEAADSSDHASVGEPVIDKLPFVEAMREAAKRIPLSILDGINPGIYSEAKNREWREDAERYRHALARGEVLTLCKTSYEKAITVAFASELNEDQRNEWLRRCLSLARDPLMLRELRKELRPLRGPNAKDIAESTYNLATDPHLRIEALQVWDTYQVKGYGSDLTHWLESAMIRLAQNRSPFPAPAPEPVPCWALQSGNP